MRFPWQKRNDAAQAETDRAKTDYEWVVQNRVTVSNLVTRLLYHGEVNGIVEAIHRVAKGQA